MRKINLAFIGWGPHAKDHYLLMKILPSSRRRVNIVGVYDADPLKRAHVKKRGLTAPESLDDLLNIPNLDAVYIASPPKFHVSQALSVLESGKHAYSEIPMALNAGDIEKLVQTEDRYSHLKYQAGENFCFIPEVLFASHLIESGQIGPAVYAEAEYIHDVTFRFFDSQADGGKPKPISNWYSEFDPLAYAHSIYPAQVALGGLQKPMEFTEVQSYATDLGGENGNPICAPSKALHVALFKASTGAIAKCMSAYVFAREPPRLTLQVVGRVGTYESYKFDKPGYLYLTDNHNVKHGHRSGTKTRIGNQKLRNFAPFAIGGRGGSGSRVMRDWIDAILTDKSPALTARKSANSCHAGIAASEAARTHKIIEIPEYNSKKIP